MKYVIIKSSKIQGKGVFATRNFKKGETVIKWDISYPLTKKEFESLSQTQKQYVTYTKRKYLLMQAPAKYINHSCEPNTTSKNFCDVAARNIKKGEEITTNYLEDAPKGFSMQCHCGSKKCKKVIKK